MASGPCFEPARAATRAATRNEPLIIINVTHEPLLGPPSNVWNVAKCRGNREGGGTNWVSKGVILEALGCPRWGDTKALPMDFLGVRRGEFETAELGRYPCVSFFHTAWRIYGALDVGVFEGQFVGETVD